MKAYFFFGLSPFFRPSALGLLVLILPCAAFQETAMAGGIVSNNSDAALRAAIAGGGTVTFAFDGTITLTNVLSIANNTTIDGSGHSITISGAKAVRLFSVSPGVSVALINLTLANGYYAGANGVAGPPVTMGGPGMGAAVWNNGGSVALTGCVLVNNTVAGGAGYSDLVNQLDSAGGPGVGGALFNQAGTLSVTNCYFGTNGCVGGTGGLYGSAGAGEGGAIASAGGTVVIQNSTFQSNSVLGGLSGGITATPTPAGNGFGGALWASNATVQCLGSTFTGNLAQGNYLPFSAGAGSAGWGGGGALFLTNGTLRVTGCSFMTNTALAGQKARYGIFGAAQGGAILSHGSSIVDQSAFYGNQAVGVGSQNGEGSGGAIFTDSMFSLSRSTLANNLAQGAAGGVMPPEANADGGIGRGGAICNYGLLNLTNCTLTGNLASGGMSGQITFVNASAGGGGLGGGLSNSNGIVTLLDVTIALNNAIGGAGSPTTPPGATGPALGGAIYNTNGTVNLYSTIVANSTSGSNYFGTVADQGYNLSSDSTPGFTSAGSLNNTDPKLGPLDNYGGPTATMAILAGSPAINGGNNASYAPVDQRGRARPFGSAPDIGAFESSSPYTIRGSISGFLLKDEVSLTVGLASTPTANHVYDLEGLAGGLYTVTPQSPKYLFLPGNRDITVGPDQLGVNFRAYAWNALSLDDSVSNTMHIVIAGTNGWTYRLLQSSNLIQWSPVSSYTIGPTNYWEMFIPMNPGNNQFYRTVAP